MCVISKISSLKAVEECPPPNFNCNCSIADHTTDNDRKIFKA